MIASISLLLISFAWLVHTSAITSQAALAFGFVFEPHASCASGIQACPPDYAPDSNCQACCQSNSNGVWTVTTVAGLDQCCFSGYPCEGGVSSLIRWSALSDGGINSWSLIAQDGGVTVTQTITETLRATTPANTGALPSFGPGTTTNTGALPTFGPGISTGTFSGPSASAYATLANGTTLYVECQNSVGSGSNNNQVCGNQDIHNGAGGSLIKTRSGLPAGTIVGVVIGVVMMTVFTGIGIRA